MHKIFFTILSLVAFSFAANIQIVAPTGADFSPDAPTMVTSLVRSAITQAGHTPIEESASIQLTTNLMVMGSSFVVVCEQKKNGVVIGSGKQKASTLDDLDVAIEQAVLSALSASKETPSSNTQVEQSSSNSSESVANTESNDDYMNKQPTRNYKSFGFGLAYWYNWKDEVHNPTRDTEFAYAIRAARIWEVSASAALILQSHTVFSFGDDTQLQETVTIGGRYFFSNSSVTPYLGGGLGFGIQADGHFDRFKEGFAFGFAGNADAGLLFFRKSSLQLELGLRYNILWDGLTAWNRNFGATSLFIAINY